MKGFIAVGFEDDSIAIIDMETMEPNARLLGHKSFVTQVKFDDHILSV